ncbi:C40 family peptidase [Nocardia mexicana]|uniref:NlpC/P60 family protein n=1 Tax=Nocardia mexicana TaxID=279262 RepID=A0A370GMN3_9NOCA|nr:C40 family peptidase [Nocardia mexicana]RDI43684.1 NlpC/P60 family protein [Nocardia mexicana]
MTGTDEVRYIRYMRRMLWWVLAAAAVVLGALGALLLTTGQAAAEPVSIPGIGSIEVPIEVQTPAEIPGIMVSIPDEGESESIPDTDAAPNNVPDPNSAVTGIVNGLQSALPGVDIRSMLSAPGIPSIPESPTAPRSDIAPGAPAPSAPAATQEKSRGELAVEAAESKIGAAYGYGSAGPDAFDCSGLVQWSYGQAGVDLPRTSYGQLSTGTPVGLDELERGDMVSFYGGGHSALYAGDGKVVHAGTNSTGVVMSDLSEMPASGARRF